MTQTFKNLRIDAVTADDLNTAIVGMDEGMIKDLTSVILKHADNNAAAESRDDHSSWFKGLHLIIFTSL